MADSVVCPVCRSHNASGAPVCVTCGAPLLDDPRPDGDGGARPSAEVTGRPPGFPLWPVGEPRPDVVPPPLPSPPSQPDATPVLAPQEALPAIAPVPSTAPGPRGTSDLGWPDDPGAAGPWGPDPAAASTSWATGGQPAPPPGWGLGPASAPPSAFRDDSGASQVGWLPVSAAPRSSRGAKQPGDCWNCGEANARNREYCKRCGQRLDSDLLVQPAGAAHPLTPVSGGRGRRAVAFIWTVLVLAVVVVVGVVAFGGFVPRDLTAAPGPVAAASLAPGAGPVGAGASVLPGASAVPVTSPIASPSAIASGPLPAASPPATRPAASLATGSDPLATATVTAAPTAPPTATPAPTVTATPAAVPVVTATPTSESHSSATPGPIRTTASPRAPAPRGFTCGRLQGVRDPQDRGWRLDGTFWAQREGFDRVTLRLVPDTTLDGRVARVIVETLTLSELEARDLPAPADGEVAVVVRFSPGMSLTRSLQAFPERPAVRTLSRFVGDGARVHVVLGVLGEGCFAVQAPMWEDPGTQDTPFVDITLDVQH